MHTHKQKKVLLTGGTSGIGRATTLLLAEAGYDISIIGRNQEKGEDLKHEAELHGVPHLVHCIYQDLADIDMLEEMLPKIWELHGPFDILINNAGLPFDSVIDASAQDLQDLIQVNLASYLRLGGYFAKRMIDEGIEGDIINIGSMSANTRDAESSGYVASKAGIQGFTEALRKETNPYGIRVSLIEPGAVATDMQPQSLDEKAALEEKMEMLCPEDIAHAIHYVLAQDRRVSVVEMMIKPTRQFI